MFHIYFFYFGVVCSSVLVSTNLREISDFLATISHFCLPFGDWQAAYCFFLTETDQVLQQETRIRVEFVGQKTKTTSQKRLKLPNTVIIICGLVTMNDL